MLAPGFSFFKCNIQTVKLHIQADRSPIKYGLLHALSRCFLSYALAKKQTERESYAEKGFLASLRIHPMVCLVVST